MAKKWYWPFGAETPAEPPLEPPRDYRAEGITFGEPSSGSGMDFRQLSAIGGYEAPDIAQACIRQILARALQAEFKGNAFAVTKAEKVHSDYVPRDFWASAFEAFLVNGNVLFYRSAGGELLFSTNSISVQPVNEATSFRNMAGGVLDPQTPLNRSSRWICNTYYPSIGATRSEIVPYTSGALAKWESRQGQSLLGSSPAKVAAPYINAYREAAEMLYSYGARGHKVARVVKQSSARSSRDESKRYLKEVQTMLEPKGSFRTIFSEHGFEMENFPNSGAPALREAIEQAAIGVARIYGVPPQLIGVQKEGDRSQPHELEDSLLRRSVVPMLDTVAAAVSKAIGSKVEYDTSKLGRPGFDGMADKVMQLGQSGSVKIDELRALLGFEPLPNKEGDKLPETAGAGYRKDEGASKPAAGGTNGGK